MSGTVVAAGTAVMPAVGQFLFDSLLKEGVTQIFGVPGDYNFALLDILDQYQRINFVNCCNELNAAYAADGYARVRGFGAVITTFGVGELSACNAIAGSYCESVPVVHIVGAPKTMVMRERRRMHHTLLDGDYDVFRRVFEELTAYAAWVTPENAALEIPAAIQKAKETKKPVYLVLPIDTVPKATQQRDFMAETRTTSAASMEEALKLVLPKLQNAQRPILISDVFVSRYGLEALVEELADKLNIPAVTMMMGKGSFNEGNPHFLGLYCGKIGSEEVRGAVESSDCVLAIGAVWDDYNTGVFTAALNPLNVVEVNPITVKIGKAVFENIWMADLLNRIMTAVTPKTAPVPQAKYPYGAPPAPADKPVTAPYFYPHFQQLIKEGDIVVAESGLAAFGLAQIRLKKGVTYIAQGGWGCIGYATPAAFGACVAAQDRRVVLVTGEGSLQVAVQELSSMLSNGCKPIVFVLNNNGYAIEKYINKPTADTGYNSVPAWDYIKLPEAFGSTAFVSRASTEKELDYAIVQAEEQCRTRLCLIEVRMPPMDAPEIVQKMRQALQEAEKRS